MSKLTQASRGQSCIRCGAPDAYAAHYNGTYQHRYGKGRGIKVSDIATAELCYNCDQLFSEGVNIYDTQEERDAEFLNLCMLTNIRRYNEGVLKI